MLCKIQGIPLKDKSSSSRINHDIHKPPRVNFFMHVSIEGTKVENGLKKGKLFWQNDYSICS